MLKKLILLVALIMFSVGAYAADGDEISTTSFRVDTNGLTYYKTLYEAATTNDTVTSAESGKTFIVTNNTDGGGVTMTLPTAAAGLTYTFVTNGLKSVILSPQSTDTFYGCVDSSIASTFTAGDDLDSPGGTGDSVTIVGASTAWYCSQRVGTWADGN